MIPLISSLRNGKTYSRMLFFLIIQCLLGNVNIHAQDNILNLASGSKTGMYFPVGRGIAGVARKENININVLNSEGSVENLTWLEKGKVQLCIAQSDAVDYAFNGVGKFSERFSSVRVIASLYTEVVHVLIRNPLYIKKMEDLRGKRISIGPIGSGTESNALAILEASGLTRNEVKLLNLSFDEINKAIRNNEVDIAFVTSGIPSDIVKMLVQDNTASIFEPKPDVLGRLMDIYPFFSVANIPSGTYAHQGEEITTIGVSALLVGRSDLDDSVAYHLTKSIFTNPVAIMQFHQMGGNINIKSALNGVSVPISNGARIFFEEEGLYNANIYLKIINYALFILLAAAISIGVVKIKKVTHFLRIKPLIRVIIFVLLVWFMGAVMLYLAEHKINENYSNIWSSIWSTLVNLINFGSKEPFTNLGRTTSTVVTVLGLGSIFWIVAQVTAVFVHNKIIGKKKMKIKDHYVIANWNDRGSGIIEQLRSPDLDEQKPIVIITEHTKLTLTTEKFESILHFPGDPTDSDILEKANIENAKSIIILAKDKAPNTADADTILTLLAVKKICKKKKIAIIAEIIDPKKVDLAIFAGDEDKNVEIVSCHHLGHKLLAQTAVFPGLSKLYEDLLTFDKAGEKDDSPEIYRYEMPSKFKNKTFNDLLHHALALRKKGIEIIPIAISNEKGVMINPTKHNEDLNSSGYFYAICSNYKHIKKFYESCEKE